VTYLNAVEQYKPTPSGSRSTVSILPAGGYRYKGSTMKDMNMYSGDNPIHLWFDKSDRHKRPLSM